MQPEVGQNTWNSYNELIYESHLLLLINFVLFVFYCVYCTFASYIFQLQSSYKSIKAKYWNKLYLEATFKLLCRRVWSQRF